MSDWPHKCPKCGKDSAADYCSVACKINFLEDQLAQKITLPDATSFEMILEDFRAPVTGERLDHDVSHELAHYLAEEVEEWFALQTRASQSSSEVQ